MVCTMKNYRRKLRDAYRHEGRRRTEGGAMRVLPQFVRCDLRRSALFRAEVDAVGRGDGF